MLASAYFPPWFFTFYSSDQSLLPFVKSRFLNYSYTYRYRYGVLYKYVWLCLGVCPTPVQTESSAYSLPDQPIKYCYTPVMVNMLIYLTTTCNWYQFLFLPVILMILLYSAMPFSATSFLFGKSHTFCKSVRYCYTC